MSAYSDIRTALTSMGYPIATNIYTGTGSTYFVITLNSFPADFSDDDPQHLTNMVMLHLYAPNALNTVTIRKQVATALVAAGFTYPSFTDVSDAETQHIVFECEGMEGA